MASKLMLRVSPVPRVQRTRTSPTNRHVTSTVAEAEQAFTSPVKRMGQTSMSSTRNIRILPDTLTGYVRSGTRKQRRWIARMCVYGALLIAIVLLAARWRRFHSREKDPSRVVMRASSALCPSPTHCTKKHKAVCRPEKLQMAALVGEAKRKLHAMRCSAHEPERVAILVPLRNRSAHAKRLRRVLGARLAHWKLDATIIFVEQSESGHFNRGKLFNVGLQLAAKREKCHTKVCFHDVDMVPAHRDKATADLYHGAKLFSPIHLVRSAECRVSSENPSGGYAPGFYGGVLCMQLDDALRINGWSNDFWGWGREDFEVGIRLVRSGLTPVRPCASRSGSFKCFPHEESTRMRSRFSFNKRLSERAWTDPALLQRGLSTLHAAIFAQPAARDVHGDGHVDVLWAKADLLPEAQDLALLGNDPCDERAWSTRSRIDCAEKKFPLAVALSETDDGHSREPDESISTA